MDSAVALAEEDLTASGTAATTTITTSGKAGEMVLVYPLVDNLRVAFGATATTSAGPIAYAEKAFRKRREWKHHQRYHVAT